MMILKNMSIIFAFFCSVSICNAMENSRQEKIRELAKSDPTKARMILAEDREALSRFGPYDPEKNHGYDYGRFLNESKDRDHSKMDYGIGIQADPGLTLEETHKRERERLEEEVKILEESLK